MAGGSVPHFQNDQGAQTVHVGAKEFMCIGAKPPFDHPHVFLDMGKAGEIICPYCSTLFKFDASLHGDATIPPGCAASEADISGKAA
jgi:uncharacterized Zn-finger protein